MTPEEIIAKTVYPSYPLEQALHFVNTDKNSGKRIYSIKEIIKCMEGVNKQLNYQAFPFSYAYYQKHKDSFDVVTTAGLKVTDLEVLYQWGRIARLQGKLPEHDSAIWTLNGVSWTDEGYPGDLKLKLKEQ